MLEEQWTGCAHGQWVTMTEIMTENHSRPGIEVLLTGSGAWTLETGFGWALLAAAHRFAGCLCHAIEDMSNFSVHEGKRLKGGKNLLKSP